jgi:hypothetical protein
MFSIVHSLGDTRRWVILAMPTGVASITIVGFGLIAIGVPYQLFYVIAAVLGIVSIFLYRFTIWPLARDESANFDLTQFKNDILEIKQWFPLIFAHSLVFAIDMACLTLFNPGCTLYVYRSRVTYRLFGVTIGHSWFMLLYNSGSFLGDFLSRRIMDERRIVHPGCYAVLLVLSVTMNLALIPEIAPLAAFGVSWVTGALYCQSTRLISELFTERYHLTATSLWLFLGDVGSTSGSNLVQLLTPVILALKSRMF